MREIKTHRINGLNEQLKVGAIGERGPGGAACSYVIEMPGGAPNNPAYLTFHRGDPKHGVNGISMEAVLAIVADRLEGFQGGPHPHVQNTAALTHVRQAIECLRRRAAEFSD